MGTHVISTVDSIRKIVQHLRISSRKCEEKSGLSSAQIFVLRNLKIAQPLSINELAAKTFTHQSTVSEVVSRLIKKGLVKRRQSGVDARRSELVLTALGRDTLIKAPRTAQEYLVKALGGMTRGQQKQLALLLSVLTEKAGFSTNREPPLFFEDSNPERKRK